MQTREENIHHTTIQYSSSNNMHSRFNLNPVTPPSSFENRTFGYVFFEKTFILTLFHYFCMFYLSSLYGQQVKGGFGMSQMNTSVDNSMRNQNPWLTSNSVGIQTWLNGPQIAVVS